MKKLISWLVIIFISFGGCESLNNNITKRIPLENFFKKTSGRDFQLSPNGEKYSFFSLKEDLEKLFIVDLNNKETYDFSGKIGEEVEKYVWLDSQTIIYQKIDTADNHSRIFSINIESSKIICLTNNEDADYRMIDNMNMVDNEMIIEVKTRTGGSWELDRLNLKSGDIKLVSGDLENIEERILDHSGKYRLAVQKEGTKSYILFRKAETESFLSLLSFDNVREIFHPLFFDSNDKNIYAYSNIGRDKVALVEFDPVIKKEVKIIYEDTDYDLFGDDETDYVKFSEHRNQPAYIFYTTWKRTYHFLDNYYANIFSRVQSEYPDYIIKFVSSDKNEERFIIKISNDRLRGKYYLFNTTDNSFLFIEDIYPWLKEEELAFRKPIRYSSRDGLVVNGYLTLPRNVEPKSLPLVVYPHGGPQWRDCWEMGRFTEIQFLANLGYAVLNVNFRGSTGYGKKFMTAGFKQNGLNVQNDITDGINYLIEKNIIDKDRVAVMGGSYGGYIIFNAQSLAGAAHKGIQVAG